MSSDRPPLEPLRPAFHVRFLTDEQLGALQEATLRILEDVGVKFPSDRALRIFEEHGAQVDRATQVVRLPRDLVWRALATVPRTFTMGARDPAFDLALGDGATYFTMDGCGVETVDLETRVQRPSRKSDVEMMARICDHLPSVGFIWPMVSAQDHGLTAPLHEMDACWSGSVKHVQSETIMGAAPVRYALEMATVLAGSREELRRRSPFTLVVCTIAPLVQDHEGIEGALEMAAAGAPVGFLAMPTLGTTAPATIPGALAMGDAEIISAVVLMQLAHPGAPVFHSIMQAWADPRSGAYVSYPLDGRWRYAPVEMAHHWGMPSLGACYGTDSPLPGTWQSAAEVAIDPFWAGLVGPEIVTGMGLVRTYTLLYPESVILDDDLYQRARAALMAPDLSEETLALDVIASVGPGGHFLAEQHTRAHMRGSLVRSLALQLDAEGRAYRDPVEVARERAAWILANHEVEPIGDAQRAEMARILAAADREIGGR
ncbi:MAG: trimethylamine methyltransferase family protein [Chloroflexi bacterium]|nr:trimethylamine methyltransferase family protein [Chloroflexota bacterium]